MQLAKCDITSNSHPTHHSARLGVSALVSCLILSPRCPCTATAERLDSQARLMAIAQPVTTPIQRHAAGWASAPYLMRVVTPMK